MKALATLVLTCALIIAAARATLAHVDSLGQPDPYWQRVAAASADGRSQPSPDGTSPLDGFVSSGGLSLLIMCLGVALTLDLATVPGRSRSERVDERASAPATAASDASGGTQRDEVFRTVEVLPASASRETRYVLRAAAAIVFGVLFISAIHASDRGTAPQTGLAPFQMTTRDATPTVQPPAVAAGRRDTP